MPLCLAVLVSFRGTVQHGLPLEIGDTVQILEKCEGKSVRTVHYGCYFPITRFIRCPAETMKAVTLSD